MDRETIVKSEWFKEQVRGAFLDGWLSALEAADDACETLRNRERGKHLVRELQNRYIKTIYEEEK